MILVAVVQQPIIFPAEDLVDPIRAAGPGGANGIHEIFGLSDDIRGIAARFAENGYVTLTPSLCGGGPKPLCILRTMQELRGAQEGRTFDALDAARHWLAARDDVDAFRRSR